MKLIIKYLLIMTLISNIGCYQPKIIAHRGYWKAANNAQNSLEGIRKADEHKFYGSEFDVRLTKDSIPIVYHDEEIEGVEVGDLLFEEIKNLKLKNGENIPTLSQYLDTSKTLQNIRLIVELKPQSNSELENYLVDKTIELINKYQLEDKADYISFSANICDLVKAKVPNAHVQYLNGDLSPQQIKSRGWDGFDYNYKILMKNQNWIKEAHDLGLSTNAWTVNSEEIFKALKNLKIQMITTDEPLKFKNL